MLVQNKSICIVASTLPVGFLVSQAEQLKIKKIIVISKSLEGAYQYFKQKYPSIQIERAPSGFLMQPLYFLGQLLAAKASNNSIVIFHECCMPLLDLLLKLIRPSGYYLPQVTMGGFEEITFGQFPKSRLTHFLNFCGLVPSFKYYRSPSIGENEPEYAVSIRDYPASIHVKGIQFSRDLISSYNLKAHGKTKKILFVTGKSYASNAEQIDIYSHLVESAVLRGYICHIKDHPNPTYRLDLSVGAAIVLDPLLPVELLDRDYAMVVGVSSSSLLAFNDRSISLANMFESMTAANRSSIANHFQKVDPENKIRYINSTDEFIRLL